MQRSKQVLVSLAAILVIGALFLMWGVPALVSKNNLITASPPYIREKNRTALVGFHVANRSRSAIIMKSVTAGILDGAELINSYADEHFMLGVGLGPPTDNDNFDELPPSLQYFKLLPGQALNVLLEFKVPMIEGEYTVSDIRVHYQQHGLPKTLKIPRFEALKIQVLE